MQKSTSFECVRDGLIIRGEEYRPEKDCLPAVILSHGFMSNRESMRHYALRLAQEGYATYIFDFNGGCLGGKSDGRHEDMSILTQIEDLRTVLHYVQSLPYIDVTRISLLGLSHGGLVTALLAPSVPDQIEKMILLAPLICIPDDARNGHISYCEFDPENIPEQLEIGGGATLGRCYAQEMQKIDPYEEIRGYDGPILLIYGTEDPVIKQHYIDKMAEVYNEDEEHCTYVAFENCGHGFIGEMEERVLDHVCDFMKKNA